MAFPMTAACPHYGENPTKSFSVTDGIFNKNRPKITFWDVYQHEFSNIHDIHDLLANQIDYAPFILMRESLHPKVDNINIRKLGDNFIDRGCWWLMLDVDEFELPEGIDPYSQEAIEYFIRNHLPSELHGITCSAHFSPSTGIIDPTKGQLVKQGLNVHLIFVLNFPATSYQASYWLKDYPVDDALFHTVQAHYVMDPVIGEGITCLVRDRHILIKGNKDVVTVPQLVKSHPRTRQYRVNGGDYPSSYHSSYIPNPKSSNDDWKNPAYGLPEPRHVMACNFMQDFVADEIHTEHRYYLARAFATNAYRTQGDAEDFVREGLDMNYPGGYTHTEDIIDKLPPTRPISCRYIVDQGYDCAHFNERGNCCMKATTIRSPYSLGLALLKGGK